MDNKEMKKRELNSEELEKVSGGAGTCDGDELEDLVEKQRKDKEGYHKLIAEHRYKIYIGQEVVHLPLESCIE